MCAAALTSLRVRAIYYGCANEKFGGLGSVVDLRHIRQKIEPQSEYSVKISGLTKVHLMLMSHTV